MDARSKPSEETINTDSVSNLKLLDGSKEILTDGALECRTPCLAQVGNSLGFTHTCTHIHTRSTHILHMDMAL